MSAPLRAARPARRPRPRRLRPGAAARPATPSRRARRGWKGTLNQSRKLRLGLDLLPGPDHLGEPRLVVAAAAVHIGKQVLDQRLVHLADLGLGLAVLARRGSRAPGARSAAGRRCGRRCAPAPGFSVALSPSSSAGSSKPKRCQARPSACGWWRGRTVAERAGRAVPDPVGGELPLEVGVGMGVEEVPVEIVLADVVEAEPEELVEMVGRLRRAVLARACSQPGRRRAAPRTRPRRRIRGRAPAASCRRRPKCRSRRASGGVIGSRSSRRRKSGARV